MSKLLNCIVIDDEPKAVSVLSNLISTIDDLKLIGSFTDPCEALTKVQELKPDLVFMDIEMPHKNGFEVVDEIRLMGLEPHIIFTTGYDEFAVKAIKKQAFDYLLKPITKSEVLELIARTRHQYAKNQPVRKGLNSRLRFNTLNGFYIVEIEEVVYIKADGNYSELFMRDTTSKLITANLATIESLLDPQTFCRIGRSLIVNVSFLTQVDRRHGKCILIIGNNKISLPISKKRIKELADMFG